MMAVVHIFHGLRGRLSGDRSAGRHVRAALPWLGLLLIYALSGLTSERPGQGATQRSLVLGRLNREHTFGQTFVVERDELVALRVLLFANPSQRDDPVILRLHYATIGMSESDALPDLAVVTLPLRALVRSELTTFAFPPLTLAFPPGAVTTTLRLDLAAPTLPPTDWITVMA